MTVEEALELFPGDEGDRIRDSFRKLHANLKFRAERAVVAISGGSDSDVMLDMVRALEPEKKVLEEGCGTCRYQLRYSKRCFCWKPMRWWQRAIDRLQRRKVDWI